MLGRRIAPTGSGNLEQGKVDTRLEMGTQIQKIAKKDCAFFLWCSGPTMDKQGYTTDDRVRFQIQNHSV
jgi:hypothetical protein